jgi:hypothetical protein
VGRYGGGSDERLERGRRGWWVPVGRETVASSPACSIRPAQEGEGGRPQTGTTKGRRFVRWGRAPAKRGAGRTDDAAFTPPPRAPDGGHGAWRHGARVEEHAAEKQRMLLCSSRERGGGMGVGRGRGRLDG